MADNPSQSQIQFHDGDLVVHPGLGRGRIIQGLPDDRVLVWFEGRSRPDKLYPFALTSLREEADLAPSTSASVEEMGHD